MVLWELTLATAYVLGLPRTYRLALRLQRRLIAPKHTKLRDFVYRRTRAVFSVAVNVHKEVQRRDISVGKNVGNRILRFLDRVRPQAQIRGSDSKIEGHFASKKTFLIKSEKLDGKQANLANITGLKKPAFKANVSGRFGDSLRNQLSNRFGRFSPKTRPYSMPMISMGLWWQPVRQNMTVSLSREASTYQMLRSDFARLPRAPLTESGFARGVIREDIAALIRRGL